MALIRNPYFLVFCVFYALGVGTLAATGVYGLGEPLFMLVIFGLALPGIAFVLCGRCRPLSLPFTLQRGELWITFALLALVTVFLVWGTDWSNTLVYAWIEKTPRFDFFLIVFRKVLVFVLIPYLVLSRLFGYRWRDFGFVDPFGRAFAPPYLLLMGALFAAFFAVQYFLGQAAQPLFRGAFPVEAVIVGGIALYLVQVVEVGLVEEFFFRAVLQTRLAAWLKSEVAGVFMMALIFGLAHAPGLYLRGAGAITALGEVPALVTALAYSVAVLSLAGLVFGVIWARTRNIYVLILIHAWVDTLAGLPDFIETFGLN